MKYRAEIDGLRAFAVLSVVIYHAFPDLLPGGFIGVDVFFVISGFLITRIILSELANGTFSFSSFFARRVRRIFPGLVLVMATGLVLGWFVLIADQFAQLGKHIAGGAAFIVNFILVNEAGYFDTAAEAKPMLHLWSLAVEEQFYIFWPLILWFAWRRRIGIVACITVVALISFALNISFVHSHPEEAFFWPIGRFWELLSGSLLAWAAVNRTAKTPRLLIDTQIPWVANALAVAGLALLFGGSVGINNELAFPGFWALIPVLGSVCIIAAGQRAVILRPVLMNPVAVWFGLISYPLYLWHWPVLTFLRINEGSAPSTDLILAAVALSIALAWLTYRFLEKPIRTRGREKQKVVLLASAMVLAGVAGLIIDQRDGFDQRHLREGVTHRDIVEMTDSNHGLARSCTRGASLEKPECATSQMPAVLLWGDSFAMHLAQAFRESATTHGFRQQTMSSCRPLFGFAVQTNKRNAKWGAQCIDRNAQTLAWLKAHPEIKYVVLASPFTFSNMAMIDGSVVPMTSGLFADRIRNTVQTLVDIGKKPVLIAPPPWSGVDTAACWRSNFATGTEDTCDFAPDAQTNEVYALLAGLEKDVPIIKLRDMICENNLCSATLNGFSLYRDAGHLSKRGSADLGKARNLMDVVIKSADEFWNQDPRP